MGSPCHNLPCNWLFCFSPWALLPWRPPSTLTTASTTMAASLTTLTMEDAHHHKHRRPHPRPVVHRAPPPPPAPVTHEDYHAAKKAHDHNLFHGHDPTHGGHTRPHGPHHSKFDKHGHAIGRREAEHAKKAEEK